MNLIFSAMILAVAVGLALSFYVFFYRTKLKLLWQIIGTLISGLIVGFVMAIITMLILWPPLLDFVTLGGLGIIVLTVGTVLTGGSVKTERSSKENEVPMLNSTILYKRRRAN